MATPKVPIVKGQYPIPYRDLTDQKKKFRSHPLGQSSSSSYNSISENEDYEDDEYVVEKILSHKNRPDGRFQYFLKWKDYPDSENSWEDEENIYATDLLEAYWRNKSTASSSSSNGYKRCVTSYPKPSTNGKTNGLQVESQFKRRASFNKKKSSSLTIFRQSNGISNHVTNSLSKPISTTNDYSLVKYRNEDSMKSNSIQKKDKIIEKEVSPQPKMQNKNVNDSLSTNKNEDREIARDVCDVNVRNSIKDVDDISSSESESSSDSDVTLKDTMEIDDENVENDDKALLPQDDLEEDEQISNKGSKSKCSKVKLGPRKPISNNRVYEKEILYDDKGMKSIIRNIDENWDPYVKEVVAIEPHDKLPNVLWIYISWRGGFTSVHLSTEVNKLCPQSIIQYYEKRIVFKGSLNYKNLTGQ
ncbi:hypothetical protein RhiirA1_450256 [Rhizophagus irregularis]|uniref:Chromo domain-containing protein n=1 Tax=Rhizophagus irregularis TaxID=588596 RepID=A0A2I1DWY4_9GLOM|nr:hypothetical protein RhiirA1_450256 [Rhizophagus irregularis]PKY14381.1 hypothetical protein RhiirB3_426363 [Rhizophagus irregularis]CAB5198578.1 unnamed protein product [Rhizophagus irregularis]CAB5392524.1 unnamed protein product [Rhizophagus irregularis]